MRSSLLVLLTGVAMGCLLISCKEKSKRSDTKKYVYRDSLCGCDMDREQMIMQCPIDALDDSVVICKIGTVNVPGSIQGSFTWLEFIQSEYFGGEGRVVNCKTGEPVFRGQRSVILSYKNKQLISDRRMEFQVYDPRAEEWIERLELPVWRNVAAAINGQITVSPDSLIFQPPFQDKRAAAAANKEYEIELKRTDHYLVTRSVDRLLVCALNGDTSSRRKLLGIEKQFSNYYQEHEDSKKLLDERIGLLRAYEAFLQKGGKRTYYDLSIFPYFKNPVKKKTST